MKHAEYWLIAALSIISMIGIVSVLSPTTIDTILRH